MTQSKKGVFSVFKQNGSNRQAPFYCRWTAEEDKLLFEAVEIHGPHKWSLIARHIPGRTPVQCSTRWLGALNPHVHKGRWSKEEDEALTASVKPYLEDPSYTEDNLPWSKIAQYIPNRTGIQCQARWTEALDPSVRKGRWKKEEDELLKLGVERFGCCWIRVAGSISGRTQRQCRTRWNQIQSKQQKTLHETAVQQIKKQQQRNKKRRSTTPSEDDLLQWKADKPSPIQLGVPDQTPFIRLSNIQPSNAIVIPSDIPSPLAGTSEEDTDYFCSSPASTCSVDTVDFNNTTSSFFNTNKMDVNHFLDDFDSALSAHFSNNQTKSTTDDLLSSFLTPEYLSQLDPDLPSLVLSNPTQHINLDHLLLDAEFITSS